MRNFLGEGETIFFPDYCDDVYMIPCVCSNRTVTLKKVHLIFKMKGKYKIKMPNESSHVEVSGDFQEPFGGGAGNRP